MGARPRPRPRGRSSRSAAGGLVLGRVCGRGLRPRGNKSLLCRRPRRSACAAPRPGRPLPRAFGIRTCPAPLPSLRAPRRAVALPARRCRRPASLRGPLPLSGRAPRVVAVARASALVPRCGPLCRPLGGGALAPSSAAAAWAGGCRGWPAALGGRRPPPWGLWPPARRAPAVGLPQVSGK